MGCHIKVIHRRHDFVLTSCWLRFTMILLNFINPKKGKDMEPKISIRDAANVLGVTVQNLHKKIKKNKLAIQKAGNKHFFTHSIANEIFNFRFSPQTVSFQIVKGGTGKTALASACAARASLLGAKVLCIDLDQQSNLTTTLGIKKVTNEMPVMIDVLNGDAKITEGIISISEGIHLFPSRIENAVIDGFLLLNKKNLGSIYKKIIDPLKKTYDLIVIDCPPSLGPSVAAITLASDMVIAPVSPEVGGVSGLALSFSELSKLEEEYSRKIPIKIIQNKFDSRTRLSRDTFAHLLEHSQYRKSTFSTYVRLSQTFPNAHADGVSIYDSLEQTGVQADIDVITREILGVMSEDEKILMKETINNTSAQE